MAIIEIQRARKVKVLKEISEKAYKLTQKVSSHIVPSVSISKRTSLDYSQLQLKGWISVTFNVTNKFLSLDAN